MSYEKVPDQTGQNWPVSTQYAAFPEQTGQNFPDDPQLENFPEEPLDGGV